ncbi:LacI family DNA-binding transcriptional regulator [Bauldia sp.]|uniref:LacI family DNA-binding transcriptional regulator n=1 Tax=Bauldia sp. TaxID=2575872 RepID=UPI003BAB755A
MKKPRITAREVASAAGVSVSAVSRAFTEGASISPRTRKKVLKAAETLSYTPNVLARSLMTQRSRLIGIVSTNFRNPAFMEIFDRFTMALQERRLRPLIFNLSASTNYDDALELLLQYRADGVIVASSTLPQAFFNALEKSDIPAVVAFGRSLTPGSIGSVAADNADGGAVAARMLHERGYQKIGFVGGPRNATTTIDRRRGFLEVIERNGLSCVETFADRYAHSAGMKAAESLLSKHNDLEALFCGDDIVAMGAADVIRSKGKRIPDDIGLIGFNDISMARWPAYDLTTIRQPFEDIVENAVAMIDDQIDGEGGAAQIRLFACKAVVRGTLRSTKETS